MKTNVLYTTQIQMDWISKEFIFKKMNDNNIAIFENIEWSLKNIYDLYDDYMIIFYIKDNIGINIQMSYYEELSEEKEVYFFWFIDEEKIIKNIMEIKNEKEEINENFIEVFKSFLPQLHEIKKTRRYKYYYNFDFDNIFEIALQVIDNNTNETTKEECKKIFYYWKIREFKSSELARQIVLICESFVDYKFNDDTMELAIENVIRDFFKI